MTPINNSIQTANSLIHAVEYGFILKAVKSLARAKVPWLNNPILGKIFDAILDKVAAAIYKDVTKFVAFKIIDIQVDNQKKDYDKHLEEFKKAVEGGKAEDIQIANQNLNSSFDRLINFDGF